MDDIDARIARLLDRLELSTLTSTEIKLIKDKIEVLESQRSTD